MLKKWQVLVPDPDIVRELSEKYNISKPSAMVLCNRGIGLDDLENYINPRLEDLGDPFDLPDMATGVARIWEAIGKQEEILIHGDFDTDGITSTALLTWVLKENGARVRSFLPHRIDDGYGLTIDSIQKGVKDEKLLITVDCGITSHEGAAYAAEQGIDVIITDHHQPGEEIPKAVAVINPKLIAESDLHVLAGVGVCFKLCHAFLKYGREHQLGGLKPDLKDGMDLVALGTVADIVPLLGENRRLVKHGMKTLTQLRRPGIHALCTVTGIEGNLKTEDIAFRLAPRINAAGRMDDAQTALDLLQSSSISDAMPLARKLEECNRERQREEEEAYQHARRKIQQSKKTSQPAIVVSDPAWHRGVIGIVASRLTQEYNRPTIVLTGDDKSLEGSGRSIAGVDLVRVLDKCTETLENHGGHPMAVGLSLLPENLERFTEAFAAEVNRTTGDRSNFMPIIKLEGRIGLDELDDRFFRELSYLGPFGHKNPAPIFQFSRVNRSRIGQVGKKHSRGTLCDDQGNFLDFICFGRKPESFPQGYWDVAAIPELNIYKGNARPQLQIIDVRPSE